MRDGEQSPGASMDKEEKLRIARSLERMQVDVIEAGFPAASQGDLDAVHAVAGAIKDSVVCGLARASRADIDKTAEAIKPANAGRIHTFLATSPIHMQEKLRMDPDEVVEQVRWAVDYARQFTDDVEFSPEDAGRSEIDFLCRVVEEAISAGASTINIPDTVGYTLPEAFGGIIRTLIERVPNSDKAIFSVHCHNDLGLAVANSLQAVINGARQVECTINGLGERAGNAALEEIVMAVRTRQDVFPVDTNLNIAEIVPASRLVSSITGFPVQPNKAIVGANAFAHESGIHQDGVIKKRETYEIMKAEDVGWAANRMVMGKHSGRNAFRTRLKELGVEIGSEDELNSAFSRFKDLADKKHEIFDEDLQALVAEKGIEQSLDRYRLDYLSVTSRTGETPVADVTLIVDGEEVNGRAEGSGPVDAAYKAIDKIVGSEATLQLYSVSNITSGTDSQGEVTVRLEDGGRFVNGHGADTDIVIASAKAYLVALNRLSYNPERFHPQHSGRYLVLRDHLMEMGIHRWVRRRPAVVDDNPVEPSVTPAEVIQDGSDWEALQGKVAACQLCVLAKSRTQTVFGAGSESARWIFVGEAPGVEEDRQGLPFVGRAGKLLTAIIESIGMKRDDVFIANVLKCRPPGNRDPMGEEVAQCHGYLQAQIDHVQPDIIIALGAFAAHALLQSVEPVARLRGDVHRYGVRETPLVVTYHPAYLLRSPLEKRKVWDDLKLALQVNFKA